MKCFFLCFFFKAAAYYENVCKLCDDYQILVLSEPLTVVTGITVYIYGLGGFGGL